MKKLAHFPILIFIIFFLVSYVITYISGVENAMLRTVFSVTLAYVLSPRRKKVETQIGVKTQITWVFLKKSIFLK